MNPVMEKLLILLKDSCSEDIDILVENFPCMKKWLQPTPTLPPTEADHVAGIHDGSITNPTANSTLSLRPVLIGTHFITQQAQVRSPALLCFLQAVASYISVVILLEDLQFADAASLTLIEALLNVKENKTELQEGKKSKGLLIVTTYRTDDATPKSDALISFLRRCRNKAECTTSYRLLGEKYDNDEGKEKLVMSCDGGSKECNPMLASSSCHQHVHRICLSDLTWDDVNECVRECGGMIKACSSEQQLEITDLVFHHSNGNPLHIRYLLLFLELDETLLQEAINKKPIPKGIDALFASILLGQDVAIQDLIRAAAALAQYGEWDVECGILEIVLQQPCTATIIQAQECGLLEYKPSRQCVRFSRSEFQIAAYNAIPYSNRSSFHLDIGRMIWSNALLLQETEGSTDREITRKVLLATMQLRNSMDLLCDFDERLYMSQLCYEAGQKSLSAGDFNTSAKLFEFSTSILGAALWRHDLYETSLVLHNAAAQAYCCIADYDNMERTLDAIFDNAKTFQDKTQAYIVLVYATGMRHQLLEAFRTASMALRELGEPVNAKPTSFTIVAHLLQTKWALRGKSDRDLFNLPVAENTDNMIVTQLLSFAMIHSYLISPEASFLLCFRLIRLAIKNGITGPSAVAFSAYGFLLCASGSIDEGYRFGRLAIQLADKFEIWRPRIQMLMFGYINHWVHPFRESLEPLQHAQRAAFKFGDLEIYAAAKNFYFIVLLNAGSLLKAVEAASRSYCQSIVTFGQRNPLLFALPFWSLVSNLTGNKEPLNLSGDIKDVDTALKYAVKEGNKFVVGSFYLNQTMWYYLVGEHSEALRMAKKAFENRRLCDYTLTFYEGLAVLAMAWTSKSYLRRRYLNRGRKLAKRMKCWAQRCPENFVNKQLLLEAEIAALNGNSTQAVVLFEQSIEGAKKEDFVHEEAIAYERMGQFQLYQGDVVNATMSLEHARTAFEKWGATTVVDRIDKLIASI
jgi:predicted ATPase